MRCLLALFCSALMFNFLLAEEKPSPVRVTAAPGDQRPFKVTEIGFLPDGSEATVQFQSKLGIFAFHFELPEAKLKKLTLLIEKERFCEGLTFWNKDGKSTDLRGLAGVAIHARGADLAIEIS